MKKIDEIDGLLKIVSHELTAGYEAKNLDGKTLRGVYEEYKVVSAKRGKMPPNFAWFMAMVSMFGCAAIAVGVWYLTGSFGFMTASALAVFVPSMVLVNRYIDKAWEYNKTIDQCEQVFEKFQQSVEALNPLGEPIGQYDEQSVRNALVILAERVFEAEEKFKKYRLQENADTYSVIQYGLWETECRDRFKKMYISVDRFGLFFKEPDLFRSAKAKRTWEDEGCPM